MLYLILLISIALNPVPEYVLATYNFYADIEITKIGIEKGGKEGNIIADYFFSLIGYDLTFTASFCLYNVIYSLIPNKKVFMYYCLINHTIAIATWIDKMEYKYDKKIPIFIIHF